MPTGSIYHCTAVLQLSLLVIAKMSVSFHEKHFMLVLFSVFINIRCLAAIFGFTCELQKKVKSPKAAAPTAS